MVYNPDTLWNNSGIYINSCPIARASENQFGQVKLNRPNSDYFSGK